MNLMQPVNRRIDELTRSTRAEIMMSIGAALFFALVMAWRLPPAQDRIQQLGFAAIFCWSLISVWWLRKEIWPSAPRADVLAASGLEYYRKQLEARRDHLRNGWIWHGPLLLACLFFLLRFFVPALNDNKLILLLLVIDGVVVIECKFDYHHDDHSFILWWWPPDFGDR